MSSNWVAVVHPESGATYYANVHTFETSWTPPPDFVDYGSKYDGNNGGDYNGENAYDASVIDDAYGADGYDYSAAAESVDAAQAESNYGYEGVGNLDNSLEVNYGNETSNATPLMWAEYFDEASGAPFYVNQLTGVTQWDKPEGFGETADIESDPNDVGANWTENIDEMSQLPYYVNLVTGESRWEKPACFVNHLEEGDAYRATHLSEVREDAGQEVSHMPESTDFIPEAGPISITPSFSGRKTIAMNNATSPTKVQSSEVTDSLGVTRLETIRKKGDKKFSLFEAVPEEDPTTLNPPAREVAERYQSPMDLAPESASKIPSKEGLATSETSSMSPIAAIKNINHYSVPSLSLPSSDPSVSQQIGADKSTIEAGRAAAAMLKDTPPTLHSLVLGRRLTSDLVAMCDSCSMEAYGNKFFNFDRKGIFGRKTTIEKLLTWKDELIKTSLKVLPQEATAMAVQLYRNVTGFTGDRTSGKPLMDHSLKILRNILPASEDLRDELYCQIIKQTRGNPSIESTTNGWLLMLVCLSSVPPSAMLKLDMMAYCASALGSSDKRIPMLAETCLHCIPLICESGARRDVPSKLELESLLRAEPCNLRIYFADNRFIQMFVHSWMRAADLVAAIRIHMGIPANSKRVYALFETNHKDEERTVEDNDGVLEMVADWEKLILSSNHAIRTSISNSQQISTDTKPPFYLVFKLLLFPSSNDIPEAIEVELEYIQAVNDVINSRYPCSELDSLSLGALQLQEQCGDHPGGNDCKYVQGKLGAFISRKFFESNKAKEEEMERRLIQLYSKLSGYSQLEARLCYLDYVKAWRTYGCSFFMVEPMNNKDLPAQVVLSIGIHGVTIMDPISKEYCAEYRHENILSWGNSATSLVIAVGNQVKNNKLYFKSLQSKELNQLLKQYAEYRSSNLL